MYQPEDWAIGHNKLRYAVKRVHARVNKAENNRAILLLSYMNLEKYDAIGKESGWYDDTQRLNNDRSGV